MDLILADVVLPDLSGARLAALLGTAFPDTPLLFTSGYPHEEVRRRGVDKFIAKPFRGSDLVAEVEAALKEGAAAVGQAAASSPA